MAKRKIRVDELLKREVSLIIHTDFRSEAVRITVTEVDVSPDLRQATVYYSVIGEGNEAEEAANFFRRRASFIRRKVASRVILKYLPFFDFRHDPSLARGAQLIETLDHLDSHET